MFTSLCHKYTTRSFLYAAAVAALLPACGAEVAAPSADDQVPYEPLSAPLPEGAREARLNPAYLSFRPAPEPGPGGRGSALPVEFRVSSRQETVLPAESGPALGKLAQHEGGVGAARSTTATREEVDLQGTVFNPDDRSKVDNTAAYPWRAMTKIYMSMPDGAGFVCSGALIAPRYVLTAGHCVHMKDHGGWASSVEVVPGLNGSYKPYGSARVTFMRSYAGWTSSQDSQYDFALLTLDRPIGDTVGWLGYGYYSSVLGVTGNLAAYDADRDGGTSQLYRFKPIASETPNNLWYYMSTAGGSSGGNIYRITNGTRYVMGVNTNHGVGTGPNQGMRIDQTKFQSLQSWISSGY